MSAPEAALRWLARHPNMELSYDRWADDAVWQVHRVSGGRNDQEWKLVATGETPLEALQAAMSAEGGKR